MLNKETAIKEDLESKLLKLQIKELEGAWHKTLTIWISITSVIIALVALFAQGYIGQYKSAVAKIDLEKAKQLKEETQNELDRLWSSKATVEGELSSAKKNLAKVQTSLSEYVKKLQQIKQSVPEENSDARTAITSLSEEIVSLRERTDQAHKSLVHDGSKARLFFFVANAYQRDQIFKIEESLNSKELYVANILTNKRKTPNVTEVRYFRKPEDKDEAEKILQTLQQDFGWEKIITSFIPDDPDSVGEGRKFQIWLAKDAL